MLIIGLIAAQSLRADKEFIKTSWANPSSRALV
jgi:hypothetical protein